VFVDRRALHRPALCKIDDEVVSSGTPRTLDELVIACIEALRLVI
jgi:hypothetical protein